MRRFTGARKSAVAMAGPIRAFIHPVPTNGTDAFRVEFRRRSRRCSGARYRIRGTASEKKGHPPDRGKRDLLRKGDFHRCRDRSNGPLFGLASIVLAQILAQRRLAHGFSESERTVTRQTYTCLPAGAPLGPTTQLTDDTTTFQMSPLSSEEGLFRFRLHVVARPMNSGR
jgi:hypothetical protein